jgi:Uma2 family endonuclease
MNAPATAPLPMPVHGEQLDWNDPSLWPDLDQLITEDDAPVDNPYSEKEMRLLTDALYCSWKGPGAGRPFRVLANVGLFNRGRNPCMVPDVMLGLDVRTPDDLMAKGHRAWFVWIVGKAPNAVLEIVSNREGGEDTHKLLDYADIGIPYYVIHDPRDLLGQGKLRAFALREGKYELIDPRWLPNIGLGLKLWQGAFEDVEDEWLRWCDESGRILPTGIEQANQEKEVRLAAEQRAQRLADKLRELGIDAGE